MGEAEPWGGRTGSAGTSREEGLNDGGSAVGARQLELRANLGLAAGTTCVPAAKQVQVHCIFLFLRLKVSASCTTVFLCQKEQSSLVSSPVSLQQDVLRLKP